MSDPEKLPAIRDATIDDIPALLTFLTPFFEQRLILSRDKDELATLVKHGFVAVCDDKIVGFTAIEVYSQKLAEIQSLAVSPEFQGCGLGRELVRCCVERAKREKVFELMAITASDQLFTDVGFDYSLPNQRRAFFYQTREHK